MTLIVVKCGSASERFAQYQSVSGLWYREQPNALIRFAASPGHARTGPRKFGLRAYRGSGARGRNRPERSWGAVAWTPTPRIGWNGTDIPPGRDLGRAPGAHAPSDLRRFPGSRFFRQPGATRQNPVRLNRRHSGQLCRKGSDGRQKPWTGFFATKLPAGGQFST